MAAGESVTPLDVAMEFVATKIAIADFIDDIHGTSPSDVSRAASTWAYESPVPLPMSTEYPGQLDEAFAERLHGRSEEILGDMMNAVGTFLTERAAGDGAR